MKISQLNGWKSPRKGEILPMPWKNLNVVVAGFHIKGKHEIPSVQHFPCSGYVFASEFGLKEILVDMKKIQCQAFFPGFWIETDNGLNTAGGVNTSEIHSKLKSSLITLSEKPNLWIADLLFFATEGGGIWSSGNFYIQNSMVSITKRGTSMSF